MPQFIGMAGRCSTAAIAPSAPPPGPRCAACTATNPRIPGIMCSRTLASTRSANSGIPSTRSPPMTTTEGLVAITTAATERPTCTAAAPTASRMAGSPRRHALNSSATSVSSQRLSSAGTAASASRHPRLPQWQRGPYGSTVMWPISPPRPAEPTTISPRVMSEPPIPSETRTNNCSALPRPAPQIASARPAKRMLLSIVTVAPNVCWILAWANWANSCSRTVGAYPSGSACCRHTVAMGPGTPRPTPRSATRLTPSVAASRWIAASVFVSLPCHDVEPAG